jgi:hypothetical protein
MNDKSSMTGSGSRQSLSADADFFGRSIFWMMDPATCGGLVFRMGEAKPSPRTQAALDELVAAGLVRCEKLEPKGVAYKPTVSFKRPGKAPLGAWPVTVPLEPAP